MPANTRNTLAVLVALSGIPVAVVADLADDVRAMKTDLKIKQHYQPGKRVEMELAQGEAALLTFVENPAGVTEFLFRHQKEGVSLVYACTGEPYNSTMITSKRLRDTRKVAAAGAREWMQCDVECTFQAGTARVTFSTETIPAERVRAILEEQRKASEARMDKLRRILSWDEAAEVPSFEMTIPGPEDPSLERLRAEYELDKVVAGAASEYERLQRIVKWAHDRWKHSGDNTPSKPDPLTILAEAKAGKRFRCVEYAIVVTGCAQALGMPARRLALKREDVETARSGAGHVVAEVWLQSLGKWVMVDGQWDAIPEQDGKPLNAVEFQEAIARKAPGLKIRSSSEMKEEAYLYWVTPYLYYFDFSLDQHQFERAPLAGGADDGTLKRGLIMLVPKGAKNPTVFQRQGRIGRCTYISNRKAFYPNPRGS